MLSLLVYLISCISETVDHPNQWAIFELQSFQLFYENAALTLIIIF